MITAIQVYYPVVIYVSLKHFPHTEERAKKSRGKIKDILCSDFVLVNYHLVNLCACICVGKTDVVSQWCAGAGL